MSSQIFQRYERKFIVTEKQKEEILDILKDYLVLDDHTGSNGYYNVYSIYFDTNSNDVIRDSMSKPVYKEKLRLRSYKLDLTNEDTIFLEIKKKYQKAGNKRRITINYKNFKNDNYLRDSSYDDYLDKEIYLEIKNFLNVYNSKPKIFIGTTRQAFYAKEDHNIRITFDKDIFYRYTNLDFKGKEGKRVLKDNVLVMEVKFPYAFPFEILKVIEKLNLQRRPFSKYAKAIEKEFKGE